MLFYSWSGSTEDKLPNVACVDDQGNERWRAELPANGIDPDCFIGLHHDGQSLVAQTFSGLKIRLDPLTGDYLS